VMADYSLETSVLLVREWLNCVSSQDFDLLGIFLDKENESSSNTKDSSSSKQYFPRVAVQDAQQARSEDDENNFFELKYADGLIYRGCIEDGVAEGEGELHVPEDWGNQNQGELVVQGWFRGGRLEERTTVEDFRDCSKTEIIHRNGVRHGPYRRFQRDGRLIQYGFYRDGSLEGRQLRVGIGNKSFYLGHMDAQNRLQGEVTYLYSNLQMAIKGEYVNDRLVRGHFVSLVGAYMGNEVGFPDMKFSEEKTSESIKYDPATFMRISRTPTLRDEYEMESVYVKQSRIPFAGEGLFAARYIEEGQLVCLFNGNRIEKNSNRTCVRWGDEDWSDFRLTLDKSTDLDIPPESQNIEDYSATLGHKACHSFQEKNAMFNEFEHPRFGVIMSIVAIKPIHTDEEVLVSYNYTLCHAPPWYQQLWVQHLVLRGLSRDLILRAREKEEAKGGIKMPDHIFQHIPE